MNTSAEQIATEILDAYIADYRKEIGGKPLYINIDLARSLIAAAVEMDREEAGRESA